MFFKLVFLLCFLVSLGNAGEPKFGVRKKLAQGNTPHAASAVSTNPPDMESAAKSKGGMASSDGPLDACALIEKLEIASVQGVEVQQMQPTRQKNGDLDISQCYYTAISADGSKNLSVYVQVIQRDPKSAPREALKEFWKERFGRESKEKRREEKDEEEAINPPLHVSGVGDEAFWLGSSRGGALFVLKKDRVVRVTVGGSNDAKAQIEKSKTLAKKALTHLR
jgi:hypothetical protein